MDRDELLRVLRAFESEALEYVLIGATAMGLHGVVRATEDIDLLVRATPENIERLRRAFRAVYPSDPSVEEIRSTDDTVEAEVKEVEGERRSSVPVQKFRSAEEMQGAPVQTMPADAFDRFVRHCARYRAISSRRHPRGVFRFRTMEEAQAAREHAGSEGDG